MPTKLKGLKITSTDLVTAGANPDAFIRLFKRKDGTEATGSDSPSDGLVQKIAAALAESMASVFGKVKLSAVAKEAKTFDEEMERERLREVTGESWSMVYTLSDSFYSIITDTELTEDAKRDMMLTSLDEFAETLRGAIPNWAQGKKAESGETVTKSAAEQAAFDAYQATKYAKNDGDTPPAGGVPKSEPGGNPGGDNPVGKSHDKEKEETDTMKIDKSKMTPEEQATLAEFEKKYGVAEQEAPAAPGGDGNVEKGAEPTAGTEAGAGPELHPEVKKAIEDNKALASKVEELTKNLETQKLIAAAKKYEAIGKKADELAPKLYDLKKAGGTAYDDTIALLDEQVALVEKSGLFGELGLNTGGSQDATGSLIAKAEEIRKANAGMGDAEAFAKAYETYPELAAQYEKVYKGRA